MATNFGKFLTHRRETLGWSQNQTAKELKCSWIAFIARNDRTPPLDRLEEWADTLRLSGEERTLFFELAWQQHAPERLREAIGRMRETIRRLKMQAQEAEAKAREDLARITDLANVVEAQKATIDQLEALVARARARGFIE